MESATGTLLVVDDSELNRDLLCRQLSRKGYAVLGVETGEQALERIAVQDFGVVLLDVMLPGLDGFQTLRAIRATHARTRLPVIMVTARDQTSDVVGAFALGANDYVNKPIDFPVLFARVETQLSLKRAEAALKEANESLERRVDERTAELQATNRHLVREASQRKQIEKELRRSEERLKSIVEHQPGGVCLLDPERRIVLANPPAEGYLALLYLQKPLVIQTLASTLKGALEGT